MLGGIIEAYFQWHYQFILRLFRIDINKLINDNPGAKHRLINIGLIILADVIGILLLLLVIIMIALLVFLLNYYF